MLIQDGSVELRQYMSQVQKVEVSTKCREENESMGHVLSNCARHKWTVYKEHHDR